MTEVIAIFQLAFSLAEWQPMRVWAFRLASSRLFVQVLCALVVCAGSVSLSWAAQLNSQISRLSWLGVELSALHLQVGETETGKAATIRIGQIQFGEHSWQALEVRCPHFYLDAKQLRCENGQLSLGVNHETLGFELQFDLLHKQGKGELRFSNEELLRFSLSDAGYLRIDALRLPVFRVLRTMLPEGSRVAETGQGRYDGRMDYDANAKIPTLRLSGLLSELGFSSEDGFQAAEGVEVALKAVFARKGDNWQWQGNVDWRKGEIYSHPIYLQAGAEFKGEGGYSSRGIVINHASLNMPGLKALEGSAELRLQPFAVHQAQLQVAEVDMAIIGPRFVAPLLLPDRADALQFAGRLVAALAIEEGQLNAVDVSLVDMGFSMSDGGMSFGPLSGVVPWRRQAPTRASLHVAGGQWQKLLLGAFDIEAQVQGETLQIDEIGVPLLDGLIRLHTLSLRRDAEGWIGNGGVEVSPISLQALASSLELPPLSGSLSASLPGLRIRPRELGLEGVLEISVFGGTVRVTQLHLLDPFRSTSRLYVDIEANRIDLAELTNTVSFGGITGRVDARIHGLEMMQWRVVGFEATILSSAGSYRRRISQRAVQNISSLGGAGPTQAIQRGVLSFFDSFGYDKLGWSCLLLNGVCYMGGLPASEEATSEETFVIVRGGGVPALNVLGYNRRVDWQELLDRLQAAIESNAGPVIE